MTSKLQPVRGTHDLIGDDMRVFRRIVEAARGVAELYGYGEMSTPVFEFTDVFHRTLGETSDVVSKETYSFTDRGGDAITLRPEFTAGIVRAFISNGLTQQLPFKAFYSGPAFRYERPQKGRLRQFHQVGVEALGVDQPWQDAETIACAMQFLDALGLASQVTLEINTLGDTESRAAYREALVAYFTTHREKLSEESRARLERNPLRILDSKQAEDREIVQGAPEMSRFFTSQARDWFAKVQETLAAMGISYRVSPRLVRGLDYYTHTVFEVTTEALGAQNTVLAGGRYDGLTRQMGGPDVPGIGWAAGVERLMLLVAQSEGGVPQPRTPVAVIPFSEGELPAALALAQEVRSRGLPAEVILKGNVGKAMKKADNMGARLALLLGEEEVKHNTVTVKDLTTGEQKKVDIGLLWKRIFVR